MQAKYIISRAVLPLLITWLCVLSMFFVPLVDSTQEPFFALNGSLAEFTYLVSESGGKVGVVVIGLLALMILILREGLPGKERWNEFLVILLIAAVFAGGGAAINEHVVKNSLAVPRPNILWLAGENGSGPLGMTAEDFYALGGKADRRPALNTALNVTPPVLVLNPSIQYHWVEETGYSFPSGHSFAAMFFSTFFLVIAVGNIRGRRLWVYYSLLPWAVMVCYSRSILRVHTPWDIAVGSMQGIIFGLIAWGVYRGAMRYVRRT